jgi:hypothetical protein
VNNSRGLLRPVVLVHLAASSLLGQRLLGHARRHRLGRVYHFRRITDGKKLLGKLAHTFLVGCFSGWEFYSGSLLSGFLGRGQLSRMNPVLFVLGSL